MLSFKKVLGANIVFSAFSGLLLVIFPATTAGLFAVEDKNIFLVTGWCVLAFAVFTAGVLKKKSITGLCLVIIQDIAWVAGSLLLLVFRPFDMAKPGYYLIAVAALVVLLLALAQSAVVAQTDTIPGRKIKHLHFTREVNATMEKTWLVISDVANYHKAAPNIDTVKIISGDKEGMIRSCSHKNNTWTETCTTWKDEETYSFVVNTAAPDYPYPFKYLQGTWRVDPVDVTITTISLSFDIIYKHKWQHTFLHPFVRTKFQKAVNELFNNWQHRLEQQETTGNFAVQ